MKQKTLWILVLFATLSSQANAGYQTYVQANKAEGGRTEAVVLVLDPSVEKTKPDTALCHLFLKDGDTKTKVVGDKNYPNRRYAFTVALKSLILHVTVVISENGRELFRDDLSFASWKGFGS